MDLDIPEGTIVVMVGDAPCTIKSCTEPVEGPAGAHYEIKIDGKFWPMCFTHIQEIFKEGGDDV
jgi:hypothetical protein